MKLWFPTRSSIQITTHSISMKLHWPVAVADYVGCVCISAVIYKKAGFDHSTQQFLPFPGHSIQGNDERKYFAKPLVWGT